MCTYIVVVRGINLMAKLLLPLFRSSLYLYTLSFSCYSSPVRRVRSNQSFTDHQIMTTPELTSPSKRRPSTTGKGNKGSRSRARRDSEVVAPPTILDPQPTFRVS